MQDPQKTPHTSPSRASYGMSFVNMWKTTVLLRHLNVYCCCRGLCCRLTRWRFQPNGFQCHQGLQDCQRLSFLGPLLLTWIYFIPAWINDDMPCELTDPFLSLIGGTVRWNRWSLGMDKLFHTTLCIRCDYVSMLGLKWIHVSKRGHWSNNAWLYLLPVYI